MFRNKRNIADLIFALFFLILSEMGETLGESKTLSCGTTTSNMTLGRLKRETTDLPLPFPSEVLDNLFSRRLFNTTMNYIVPCVEVTLPLRTEDGNTVHLAMQVINADTIYIQAYLLLKRINSVCDFDCTFLGISGFV